MRCEPSCQWSRLLPPASFYCKSSAPPTSLNLKCPQALMSLLCFPPCSPCCAACPRSTAFKEGRYPEAVRHYQEALKRGPPSVNPEAHKVYSNLAACYTKLGAYPEGVKAADT